MLLDSIHLVDSDQRFVLEEGVCSFIHPCDWTRQYLGLGIRSKFQTERSSYGCNAQRMQELIILSQ